MSSANLSLHASPRRLLRRAAIPAGVLAALAAASLTPVAITAAAAATANPSPNSGARENATRLSFNLSGTASLSVDVATGNALINDQLITLPGINGDVPVAMAFNSAAVGTAMPSSLGAVGNGWVMSGFDQRLVANADGSVSYYGPAGLTGVFTPKASPAGSFNQPSDFQADLTAVSGGGWTLLMHQSQNTSTFNASGVLTSVKDRNSNTTTFNLDPYNHPASIVTPRGAGQGQYATGSTTATVSTSGGRITQVAEAAAGLSRSVSVGYDSSNRVHTVTDPISGVTTFGYGTGTATSPTNQIVSITNPSGEQTTLTYSGFKVTAISQTNTATGSPGTSTTRLTYSAASGNTPAQTLVADPTTNQSQAVAAVAHTTYSIDAATTLVSTVIDADGHSQSATYNPQNNVTMTQTNSANGQTSYTYGANAQPGQSVGESLTASQSPGGASTSATYGANPAAATKYEPSTTTNSSGNMLTSTYDGQGNQTQSSQNKVAAVVGYNTPYGQPTSSQSPGAASNVQTTYTYDGTSHNLTAITPVAGAGLGARAYTWDGFGRLSTATDGRGDTLTYTYDKADRVTKVDYSDNYANDVTYTYDAENRPTQRVDSSGTTTWTYDDLGRMTSMANTAGGGTETYRYDLAGALASKADTSGTTSYTYTAGHRVATMSYPQGSGANLTTKFAYDPAGRRSDIWMQTGTAVDANGNPTVWAAHEHTTYDTSGRVTTELGQEGPATSPTTVVNQTACYNTAPTAPTCGTNTAYDVGQIQFIVDAVSGETAKFGYDSAGTTGQTGRLLTTTITGGSNPRTYTYGYNPAGDRTTATVTGSSPSSQTLTFNNANQITTAGYTYDASGDQTNNPTNQASFNSAGQQTTTTSTTGHVTNYTYAGTNSNELLSESNANVTYHLVYGKADQSGLPEIEQLSANGNTAYVQHDPTTGAPLMLQTSSNVNCLYMTDITGNPILLSTSFQTTSFAESYDPYGSATQTGGTTTNGGVTQNPYLYHFGLEDRVTGKVKFGGRFYDPTTGTWTQQDTLNAPLDPGNANRYAYAGGDPINAADATGTWELSISGCMFYVCGEVNLGTNDDGDFDMGVGVGGGTGDDGTGSSAGASFSGGNLTSGGFASASCSLGDTEVGGTVNSDGVEPDAALTTPSSGECSGFIGVNG